MSFRYSRPLLCSGLSVELLAFSFATGASDSVVRDAAGNLVGSVTRTAAGKYTVQFNKPYPKQITAVGEPSVRQPAGTTAKAHCNVPSDTGYDAATGQFLVEIVVDDGTPAIEDPAAGSRVEVLAVARTFGATLVED